MTEKIFPFGAELIRRIEERTPTPFHVYDARGIVANARRLREAFAWSAGFKNFFAVKAAPNPALLKLLKTEGCGADCSSMAELILAQRAGITGGDIIFSSNDTPAAEFKAAFDMGAIINLDDISHIAAVERACGRLPETVCCRFNPGAAKKGNAIIGNPEEAKYGFTKPQLIGGFKTLKAKGVKKFGLHTMVASNELNPEYFVETAKVLFETGAEVAKEAGIVFDFVNLGGGIGIPYKPEQDAVDLDFIGAGVKKLRDEIFVANGFPAPRIATECGRMITGPAGWLVSRVLHVKRTYKTYAGLDACMANLMRPALYGAYHHITVLGKENAPHDRVYDVTGSLCENNDKFAVNRALPELERGDIVVIHDTGAHGHAMGFNYNGKLRSAEWLAREDGAPELIRRAETLDDLFAMLIVES
ncbi:MAG: diaminopimelate decarboxylase [Kiritimatiellaeota bacterium]|nr:diaminopimelate decarboxylase [Kiritimatiellota bacterium]